MEDCFDYRTYWELIGRLAATHRIVRFRDVRDGFPSGPFCILRHDVDYSTTAALALAEQESERGVHATYFLLPNSLYYNLLDPQHAAVPRRLVELGHEVGLHYDVALFRQFERARMTEILQIQASLLETLSGTPVHSIAMHQPGVNVEDPLRHAGRFLNAYDNRFFREMPYISDSCRAWRDAAWHVLSSALPDRFQLALHPINWSTVDRNRESVFRQVHRELAGTIAVAERDLLRKIANHPAVHEHETRRRSLEMARGRA